MPLGERHRGIGCRSLRHTQQRQEAKGEGTEATYFVVRYRVSILSDEGNFKSLIVLALLVPVFVKTIFSFSGERRGARTTPRE